MSVIAPETRVLARDALPALGLLTAFLFAWGCIKMLDGFVRALFGTVEGVVGWIPFAGRVVKRPIHKIEQKISYALGSAERKIDAHIATSFHKLAAVIRHVPGDLLDQAKLLLGLAILFGYLPSKKLVLLLIHAATMPIHAAERELDALLSRLRQGYKGVAHFVGHNIWARLLGLAAIVAAIAHELPGLRARERALEHDLAKLRDWVKHRKISLTSGAFLGAFVWALGKLGLRWIRCSKVGKVGNALCHAPMRNIEALLGLLSVVWSISHVRTVAHYAEAISEEVARDMLKVAGAGDFPRDRFTIE